MASSPSSYQVLNTDDHAKPLIFVHIPSAIKLNASNYFIWHKQLRVILIGHNLLRFVDGTHPCPSPTLPGPNSSIPNPEFSTWVRQEQILYGALLGTLPPSLISLFSSSETSQSFWDSLANTYAKSSCGHIKQLKHKLRLISKDHRSINEYMHEIKAYVDRLVLMGEHLDHEDSIDRVLSGLDESYNTFAESINGRDTPISFDELHGKLLQKEFCPSQQSNPVLPSVPTTTFTAYSCSSPSPPNNYSKHGLLPTLVAASSVSSCPPLHYLGKCQWCREQGHSVT